jgi:hypothetical protein
MSGLFGGGGGNGGGGGVMQSIASMIPSLPKPRVTRMPTETDPSVLAAARRTRQSALKSKGRLSTIMTDQTQDTVGSSGTALGA